MSLCFKAGTFTGGPVGKPYKRAAVSWSELLTWYPLLFSFVARFLRAFVRNRICLPKQALIRQLQRFILNPAVRPASIILIGQSLEHRAWAAVVEVNLANAGG